MSTSDSFADVRYMLQNPEGGETPRMEVKDEDAFNYTHNWIKDYVEGVEDEQPMFPPELYADEDRDQLQAQTLQGTPVYFYSGDEEYIWRVENREDEINTQLFRSSE